MAECHWKCHKCGIEIDTVGPVNLQLQINTHNHMYHNAPVKPIGIPHTWQCSRCGEVVSRSDEASLNLAIVGHDRFQHWQEPEKVPGCTPVSVSAPYGGWTTADRRLLEGMKIIW